MSNLGDVLKNKIYLLKNAPIKAKKGISFSKILKDIIAEEIKVFGKAIDSTILFQIYKKILLDNQKYIPSYFLQNPPSSNLPRCLVILRGVISSNTFEKSGLANYPNIKATKKENENGNNYRIEYIYIKENIFDNTINNQNLTKKFMEKNNEIKQKNMNLNTKHNNQVNSNNVLDKKFNC